MSQSTMNVNDVEKRWSRPQSFRGAALFVIAVVALAAAAATIYLLAGSSSMLWALAPAAVLVVGGIVAFVQAYRTWKRGQSWPVWQGAGWILFALMLVSLGLAGTS